MRTFDLLASADRERIRLCAVIDTEVRPRKGGSSIIEDFIQSYLSEKVPNLPSDLLSRESYDHESGLLSTERIKTDGLGIWAARLNEPDSTVPGRSWSLELSVGNVDQRVIFGSRLSCFSRHFDFVYEPGVPRVYKDLVSQGIVFGDGVKLSRDPTDISDVEDVDWLVALINNPKRRTNIIAFSCDDRGMCAMNPNIFSDRLCVAAHVVRVYPHASFLLSDRLGKYLSIFDLGIRIYRPTADIESEDPLSHTLYTRHMLSRLDASRLQNSISLDAFNTTVEGTIRAQPNPTFVQIRSANATFRLTKLRNETGAPGIASLQNQIKAADDARIASETQAKESLDLAVQEEARRKEAETERDQEKARGMVLAARVRALEARIGSVVDESHPRPQQYDEVSEWIEREFASRMKLHARALRGLKTAVFEDIGIVCDLLQLLAVEYVDSKRGNRQAWKRFEDGYKGGGVEYSRSISDSRAGERGDEYFVRYKGQREFLEWHLKRGNSRDPRRDLRIYFFWDEEDQEVVVGFLPGHLDNRLT